MAKRPPRVATVKDLPRIRETITEIENAAYLEEFGVVPGVPMTEAELWWVSWEMTMYAAETADTVPLSDPAFARPSLSGVLIWERGTGIECDANFTETTTGPLGQRLHPSASVCGAYWFGTAVGMELGVLGVMPASPGPWPIATTGVYPDGTMQSDHYLPVWRLLTATWLLAAQTSITTRIRRPLDSGMPPGLTMPSEVSVVHLRQRIIDEHAASAASGDGGEGGRDYSHRWWVRGHWREARVGKGRLQTRATWVIPHVRGPDGKPLVDKDQVVAWTRR